MKTKFLSLLMIISLNSFSQEYSMKDTLRTQVFSLSPISKNVDKVNGLVFGLGHLDNKHVSVQIINGLNIEANPAPIAGTFIAFLGIIYLPEIIKNSNEEFRLKKLKGDQLKIKDFDAVSNLKLNGINLSTGCFLTNTSMNGLNISLGNKFKKFNGLSIAPLGTISTIQNGVSIGLINANNNLNGISVGVYNQSFNLKGLQLGICNISKSNNGIQIGIFNKSYSKGFQLGLWNKNLKRSLPILNW